MALTPYPKLKTALFPQYSSPSVLPPDITLYHLIQVQYLGSSLYMHQSEFSRKTENTLPLLSGRHFTLTQSKIKLWTLCSENLHIGNNLLIFQRNSQIPRFLFNFFFQLKGPFFLWHKHSRVLCNSIKVQKSLLLLMKIILRMGWCYSKVCSADWCWSVRTACCWNAMKLGSWSRM
jgi:hypothetical protein